MIDVSRRTIGVINSYLYPHVLFSFRRDETMPAKYFSIFPTAGDPESMPVRDVAASIPFYEKTFGFKVSERTDTSATFVKDEIKWTIVYDLTREPEMASLHFVVSDADEAHAEIVATGCQALARCRVTEPHDWDGGPDLKLRMFNVVCPDGLCFSVGHNLNPKDRRQDEGKEEPEEKEEMEE